MIHIGNAPCSWGAFELNQGQQPVPYSKVLDEMQAAGYEGTDLGDWGYMPTDPAQLKDALQKRSLHLISAFVPVNFKEKASLPEAEIRALETARLLSAVEGNSAFLVLSDLNGHSPIRTLNAGRIRPEMGLLPFQWQAYASGVEQVARIVKEETGIQTVFHHHCAGYVETEGEVGMLLDYTDPDLVGLCLDTGHYRFAGGDPLRLFQVFADRVRLVHFKDCDPLLAARSREEGWDYSESIRQGIFCELGQGDVDFPAVKVELEKIDYQGWIVVEQDQLPGRGTPLESARRNRDFIRSIGL